MKRRKKGELAYLPILKGEKKTDSEMSFQSNRQRNVSQ
jgi:hypothetical protein